MTRRWRFWGMVLLAVFILAPALVGFGMKFRELLLLAGDKDGAFTVMPILNYLLVSLGFLFLFGWALLHGMFRDIEAPKYSMLENEHKLDAEEAERRQALTRDW